MAEQDIIESIEAVPGNLRIGEKLRLRDSVERFGTGHVGSGERWKIIQKRRWTILAVWLGVFTFVLIATMKEKPVYQARGLMEIEQENPGVVTVQDLFQTGNVSDDYLATQYKILQSDTLARQVIRQLRLDQVAEFNAPKWDWPWRTTHSMEAGDEASLSSEVAHEQSVVRRFEEGLSVTPVERSRLVRVSFDAEDPKLAADVVNALTSAYIEESLQMHWDATQRASAWLSQQLDGLKIKLEKSEDELQAYVEANGLLLVADDKGQTENMVEERLRELQQELTQAQAERYQKEAAYRQVQTGDYDSLPGTAENKLVQDLTDRLADLERQRAELAPDFKPDYPKMKQIQSEIDRLNQLIQEQHAEAAKQISSDYLAALRRETLVHQALEKQRKEANIVAEKSVKYNILKREVESNQQMYEGLLQRLKEAGISAGMKASNIRIVDAAVPPVSPVKPRFIVNLMLGLFIGLACGLAVAFAQERLDCTLKTGEEIECLLGVPALASIPLQKTIVPTTNGKRIEAGSSSFNNVPNSGGIGIVATRATARETRWIRLETKGYSDPDWPEAFRGLRTSVLLSRVGHPPRSILIASAELGEGKTTICCNLAISFAQLDKRVLVVDADLRRPRVHEFFRERGETGLVNYLTGDADWQRLVVATASKNLDLLACGPEPPNPCELLSSDRMQEMIREAVSVYDFIFVDSPPLLHIADARILANYAEGTILTVRGGSTSRESIRRAQLQISSAGGHLVGAVLNQFEARRVEYFSWSDASIREQRKSAELERDEISKVSTC